MTVEIDEAIRRDPELLRDVEAATLMLRNAATYITGYRLPRTARWCHIGGFNNVIELWLHDSTSSRDVESKSRFEASLIAGEQTRKISVLMALSDLQGERVKSHPAIEAQLLRVLREMEEANAPKV